MCCGNSEIETTGNSNVTTVVLKTTRGKLWTGAQYLSAPEWNLHFSVLLPHFSATQWSVLCHHSLASLLELFLPAFSSRFNHRLAQQLRHPCIGAAKPSAEGWNTTGYVTKWKKWVYWKGEDIVHQMRIIVPTSRSQLRMIKQKRNVLKRHLANHRIIESKLETKCSRKFPQTML